MYLSFAFRTSTAIRLPGALLVTALLAGPAGAADSAVILQYHHVDASTPPSTSVSPEVFAAHLNYLEERRFTVLPVSEIVEALGSGRELPDLCVGITFDDAYSSVGESAWPLLRERGWPATIFVTTGGVDDGIASYLTWDEMKQMAAEGAEFGGHSVTHDYLIRRRPDESESEWHRRVREDIRVSCERVEEQLLSGDARCRLFAYPYGEYDRALREIVADLGLVGFGQHSGPVGPLSDTLALPRFPASGPYADLGDLATKLYTLPLPVRRADPLDPVLPEDLERPVLRLELAAGDYRLRELAAYASGQGRIDIRIVREGDPEATAGAADRERDPTETPAGAVIEIVPSADLPEGRSRYNITAPQRGSDPATLPGFPEGVPGGLPGGVRYYWYSHLWIR